MDNITNSKYNIFCIYIYNILLNILNTVFINPIKYIKEHNKPVIKEVTVYRISPDIIKEIRSKALRNNIEQVTDSNRAAYVLGSESVIQYITDNYLEGK